MNYIKYILSVFIVSLLVVGCDKDFEEINANIDDPVVVPSSMLIGTVVRNVTNSVYSTFNGGEIGENWMQHQSLLQYNDPDRYKPRETSMDGMWNTFYLAASDAHQMQALAVAEENEVNQGIALVLKAYCFSLLTDYYGDIPFSEALLGPSSEGIFFPAYDAQADVYAGIFAMLDEAIPLLAGSGDTDPNMDIMYAGDASKWRKFAASLKFRGLMRISAKQDVSADLQALVNSGNLFSSNADEAKLVYLASSPEANPMFETIVDQGRAEHALAATFVNYLIEVSDPRISAYCQPAANTGSYVGKPSGNAESPLPGFSYGDVSNIGLPYLEATAPGYWLSYTELLLLQAEAAKKGFISGGDAAAEAYYAAAITNSFAENGVGSAAAFLTQSGIAYTPGNALEQIYRQKWVTLFAQGFECWTEWRRTQSPALTPVIDGYLSEIPSRLKYNSKEQAINGPNYDAALTAQGPDELTTKVWWMN
jgi:hypothetical protein